MTNPSNAAVPLHLAGNNAPVTEEFTVEPTEVIGEIPADLNGMFVRNGPNPRTGWSPHYFAGDGMVHAVALAEGRARWYRNRYVRTPLYHHPGRSRFELGFDPATATIITESPPPTPTSSPTRADFWRSRKAASPTTSPQNWRL
ncbi:carotenoid oxygenase family protein [Nocardia asiatica]|uniref:carotenoid oxygenase family protein n=1 Tax=Nocardia asiatica TaxID=209252 RepID=UPI003EE3AF72